MMEEASGDNWSCKTCKAPVKYHQQTNIQLFTKAECLPGPGIFNKKKIKDFPGGVGTLMIRE